MGFPKALVLVQLSLLLVSTVVAKEMPEPPATPPHPDHHDHYHHHPPMPSPPAHAPVHPPAHPPTLPPRPPAHPPVFHFPRSLLAVQGVVYCKPCKYAGMDTLWGAYPIKGAIVKLQCNNTKHSTELKGTTDEHGYFIIQASKNISSYGAHKCKASLVASNDAACSIATNLHGGETGGPLRPEKKFITIGKIPCSLYSVGPFAFEPKCPH